MEYRQRQQRLLTQLPEDTLLIMPNQPTALRTNDVDFPYRSHSDILYLTGWTEMNSVLVAQHQSDSGWEVALFVPPKDTEKEIWTGIRPGIEGALQSHPIDAAYSILEIERRLGEMMSICRTVALSPGIDLKFDKMVQAALTESNRPRQRYGTGPTATLDPRPLIAEMRLRKSDAEIQLMQEAADIASDAHRHAMKGAYSKMGEWQLQALVEGYFLSKRSNWSYPSIVAGGDNATILHYHANNCEINDGDLVLIDAGCEVNGYASDITRTFPVNGKFTDEQREIYEIVLASQKAAIKECVVGNPFDAPHEAAKRVLAEGLVKLGIIPEDIDDPTAPEYLGKWYMHNTGHWLGLDVHDVGIYVPGGADSEPRLLEQGMVLTVEPGLYFGEWRTDVAIPKKYAGIGIRIEDDIVITTAEPLVMTASCPKEIDDIESMIQS